MIKLYKKLRLFFLAKEAIKKLLFQKNNQKKNIGNRPELNNLIKDYTQKIFKLHKNIRTVDYAFYLKNSKHEESKQFILVPLLMYTVQIDCCTKIKIIISINEPKYIKFKLYVEGKSIKNAEMTDIDSCFAVIEILVNANKCNDEK